MVLKKILINNFRNYGHQEIEFNRKFNFIYGNNGQGKTNILEAASFVSLSKSFLGSTESDCVKFGENEFFIEAEYENDLEVTENISVAYNALSKSKRLVLNKEKVSRQASEVFGRFPVVFFSPHDLNVTYGNPSERRRFFDVMISQASKIYLGLLKELTRIVKQKNALLRNYTVHSRISEQDTKDLIISYNEKLTEVSYDVVKKRLEFLTDFKDYFSKNFAELVSEGTSASVSYNSEITGEITEVPEGLKEKTAAYLESVIRNEMARGSTLAGPQRDDYIFRINKEGEYFDLKSYASQGEHKTYLVALKMSEYDYLREKKSTSPIIMLDDALSELDHSRVAKIISHLKEFGQVFLTTTDLEYSNSLKEFYEPDEMSIFRVEQGEVIGAV